MQERARDWRMWSYLRLPIFPSSTSTSARSGRPGVGIRGPKLVFSHTSPFGSRLSRRLSHLSALRGQVVPDCSVRAWVKIGPHDPECG
jgi:hypothetical protein